jgi:hypothetical protein
MTSEDVNIESLQRRLDGEGIADTPLVFYHITGST